jgi:tetratricopeptide (TPR) repeat protein
MKKMKNLLYITVLLSICISCKKSDFLNKKPNTDITEPTTLTDFQLLLDNMAVMNSTGGLAQVSADDQIVSYPTYQAATATERNAYIWNKDIYGGDTGITDWNLPYQTVFYTNIVLEGLAKSDSISSTKGQYLKGWALFFRAFAFYDLTRNFCKAYDAASVDKDLGIPLRLSSAVDYVKPRATLEESFNQIFADLAESVVLLPSTRPASNLNRPSKLAAYALLARISLDMRNYTAAEKYAEQALELYSKLIDYNVVSQTSITPFPRTNDELICNFGQGVAYSYMNANYADAPDKVSPLLIALYAPGDLRLKVFYGQNADGSFYKKRGYNGSGAYPFTGLATDEIYLIKAECLARRSETTAAMDKLNQLLVLRFDKSKTYRPVTASSPADALNKILLERRKELVWRGLRWHDLKRLNKEGANITLSRVLNGTTYILPPNDPRYVFSIPNDEITLSGIEQNPR